jgi:hypothetical protein
MDARKTLLENMEKIQDKASIKSNSEFYNSKTGKRLQMQTLPKLVLDHN